MTSLTVTEGRQIELVHGDITTERLDAIANAANEALRGGGGVDGAIHRAAGPGMLEELRQRYPDGTPTGSAVATGGHELPCTLGAACRRAGLAGRRQRRGSPPRCRLSVLPAPGR